MEFRIWADTGQVGKDWELLADQLLTALQESPRALGPIAQGKIGALGVVFMLEAPDAGAAATEALEVLSDAFRLSGIKSPLAKFEVELANESEVDMIGASDVAVLLDVSRQRVYQLLEEREDFPRPAGELARGSVWRKRDIEGWKARADRSSGRPRAVRPAAREA